jgi:hypothetical protein
LYLHLATLSAKVAVGDYVFGGQELARADTTGFASGPHLHFMVESTPSPNERSAEGWWWTQSLAIRFADAGLPMQSQTHVSASWPQSSLDPGCKPYVVVAGDTGARISHMFGITYPQLNAANPNVKFFFGQKGQAAGAHDVQRGETICIP